jgi:hypothetical protein
MLSEQALQELEKTNPDLVAKYRAKMQASGESTQSARDMQDYGAIANVAGQTMTDLANSRKKGTVLYNNMQNLGRSPEVREAQQDKYNPGVINDVTSRSVARAKEDETKAESGFWNEEKLRDLGQGRADADLKRGDEAKARDSQARRADPKSAESAAAREYLKSVAPNAASIPGFENLTAEQAEKAAPGLMQRQQQDTQAQQHKEDMDQRSADRRESAAQRAADRDAMRGARREEKADAQAFTVAQTDKANTEKKKTTLAEIEDRRTNIQQNLDVLDNMIKENGTWEATGSHNQDLNRLVEQVATDMAKLQDPGSVARPSEVEAVKANLISAGFGNSNDTAREIIKNFRKEVDRRADGAYTIRGIDKPTASPRQTDPANKPAWAK